MRRVPATLIAAVIALALVPTRVEAIDAWGPGLLRGRYPDVGPKTLLWTDGDLSTYGWIGGRQTLVWTLPDPTEIRAVYLYGYTELELRFVDAFGRVVYTSPKRDSYGFQVVFEQPVPGVTAVQVFNHRIYQSALWEIDVWGVRAPEPPVGLTATQTGPGTVLLEWQPADDFAATWRIYQDGQLIAEIPSTQTQYTVTGLAVGTYTFGVSGVESGGAEGARTEVTVYVADVTPPASPGGLRAQPMQAAVRLWWQPVPDPDLDHYRVYQDGQLIGTTTDTTYTVWGLEPDTLYRFGVSAVDQAGNESEQVVVETRTRPTSPLRARVELPNLPAHLWDGLRLYGPLWLVSAGLLLGGGLVEQVLALVARLRR